MATLAVYNGKGGVGKTTIACNLAAEAAASGYRVLLWELDSQGDSSWLLGGEAPVRPDLSQVVSGTADVEAFIQCSTVDGLWMIPSDTDMRHADNLFTALARQQRLHRLFDRLKERFDLIVFDCPPGLHDANVQLLQHADLIVMPCQPSPLAMNSLVRVRALAQRMRGSNAPVLPVLSMVDRRRGSHRDVVAEHPDWPVVPYFSDIERMSTLRAPVRSFAPRSEAGRALDRLWRGMEAWLHEASLLRKTGAESIAASSPVDTVPLRRTARERRPAAIGSVRRIFTREVHRLG